MAARKTHTPAKSGGGQSSPEAAFTRSQALDPAAQQADAANEELEAAGWTTTPAATIAVVVVRESNAAELLLNGNPLAFKITIRSSAVLAAALLAYANSMPVILKYWSGAGDRLGEVAYIKLA